jgi:hypothetical protein
MINKYIVTYNYDPVISKFILIIILAYPYLLNAAHAQDPHQKLLLLGKQERTTFDEKWDAQSGSFIVRSDMRNEDTLTCYFSFPMAKGKRESPRKKDVVYFFHTPNPDGTKVLDNAICAKFVRDYGMSVFGISFRASSKAGLFYRNDEQRNQFYTFAQSGSFRGIVTAWTVVRAQLGIERPDFFLYGYSAGGIAVQRFAEEYPEYAAGIVSVNGHTFVQKNGATCPHFILHSFGDGGMSAGHGLQRYCAYREVPCVRYLLSPKWGGLLEGNDGAFHGVNSGVVDLATSFLVGLADLRQNARQKNPAAKIPPINQWPYVALAQDPLQVVPGREAEKLQRGNTEPIIPIPSAAFYSILLERPLPPCLVKIAEQPLYAMRPRPDAPVSAQLLICAEVGDLTKSDDHRYYQESFLAGQYLAENGVATHIYSGATPPVAVVKEWPPLSPRQLVSQFAEVSQQPTQKNRPIVAVKLTDPTPETMMLGAPFTHVIIQLSTPTVLDTYLAGLQTMLRRGQHVLVLLPYTTSEAYNNATTAINPEIRNQIFPSFVLTGKNLTLSLQIYQFKAINYFLTGKLDSL